LGNLYRLLSPYKNARSAIMYVGKDKELAVVFAYCHKTFYDDDYFNLQLDGLDENGYYQLTEINHTDDSPHQPFAEGGIFSGEFLMTHGITLFLHNLASSVVFKLTKVKNN
jgi:alpha-galactosidase